MEDNGIGNPENLRETMKVVDLHVSRPEGKGNGAPDVPKTGEFARIDEGACLLSLAGELQNLIITNLHPSAGMLKTE